MEIPTNRIICGDCLEGLRTLPDNCVDFVCVDVPYDGHYDFTSAGGFTNQKGLHNQQEIKNFSEGFDFAVLDELCRVMKKINIMIFCSKAQIIPLLDYFVKERGCLWEPMRWIKDNPLPTVNNKFLPDTEYIQFFRESGVKMYGDWTNRHTYYITHINVEDKKLYDHPTVKPLSILKKLITNCSQPGDLVLDPFAGSGSTLVAAKQLGRRFLGWEIEEKYCETARRRLARVQDDMDNELF